MKPSLLLHEELWRADLYRLLALGFDRPTPDQREGIHDIALDLAHETNDEVIGYLLKNVASHSLGTVESFEAEYHRLFTTEVHCPCSEGSYLMVERGPILGDVTAFYEAFGLRTLAEQGPPDSIKMELAYLSYMALKKAHAQQEKKTDALHVTADARRQFLEDHLGRWAPVFVARLLAETEHPFYRSLAHLLKLWLKKECQCFSITPAPLAMSLPSFSETDITCTQRGDDGILAEF